MAKQYLDKSGLTYLWSKMKDTFATKSAVDALESRFTIRTVSYSFTVSANRSAYTNLYNLINSDLPSGGVYKGIVGFTTNNSNVLPVAIQYVNNDYSLQVRNLTSSSITTNVTVRYLCFL